MEINEAREYAAKWREMLELSNEKRFHFSPGLKIMQAIRILEENNIEW